MKKADGMRISSPALVALVGYALIATMVLLPINMYVWDDARQGYVKQSYDFWQRLLLVVLLSFPFILSIYSVNCMVVGDCMLWSWIVALATLLWALIVLGTTYAARGFKLDDVAA
jgi:hypothetical protein